MAYSLKNLNVAINKLINEFKSDKVYVKASKGKLINLCGLSKDVVVKFNLPLESHVDIKPILLSDDPEDEFNYTDSAALFNYIDSNSTSHSYSCYSKFFTDYTPNITYLDKNVILADVFSPLTKKIDLESPKDNSFIWVGHDQNFYLISNLGIKSIDLSNFDMSLDDTLSNMFISVDSIRSIIKILRISSSNCNQVKLGKIEKDNNTFFTLQVPKASITFKCLDAKELSFSLPTFIQDYRDESKYCISSMKLPLFTCACISDECLEEEIKQHSVDKLLSLNVVDYDENKQTALIDIQIKFPKSNANDLNLKFNVPVFSEKIYFSSINLNFYTLSKVFKGAVDPFKDNEEETCFILNYIENAAYLELIQITNNVEIVKVYIPVYFDTIS